MLARRDGGRDEREMVRHLDRHRDDIDIRAGDEFIDAGKGAQASGGRRAGAAFGRTVGDTRDREIVRQRLKGRQMRRRRPASPRFETYNPTPKASLIHF